VRQGFRKVRKDLSRQNRYYENALISQSFNLIQKTFVPFASLIFAVFVFKIIEHKGKASVAHPIKKRGAKYRSPSSLINNPPHPFVKHFSSRRPAIALLISILSVNI
jgi:hypothetical protein